MQIVPTKLIESLVYRLEFALRKLTPGYSLVIPVEQNDDGFTEHIDEKIKSINREYQQGENCVILSRAAMKFTDDKIYIVITCKKGTHS